MIVFSMDGIFLQLSVMARVKAKRHFYYIILSTEHKISLSSYISIFHDFVICYFWFHYFILY